jgi:hypothetical protein
MLSGYDRVGGVVWLPRMLAKVRLHAAGRLHADFVGNMGKGFDGRCVRFLGIGYDEMAARVLAGASDEEILAWAMEKGSGPTAEQIVVWSEFLIKRGWRDTDQPPGKLQDYKEASGLGARDDILTYFDFYEVDEGRRP